MIPVNNLTNTTIQNCNSDSINIRDYLTSDALGNRANLLISSMNITTLPESISEFQEIHTIYIINTPMTSLPESIGDLPNLEQITLINTSISALPNSIGRLPLEYLTISNAPISSLPDSIGNINNLSLSLNNTRITTLPNTVTNLSHLFFNSPIAVTLELTEYIESRSQIQMASSRQTTARQSRQPQRNIEIIQNRRRRTNTVTTPSRQEYRSVSRLDFYRESEPSSFESNLDQLYSSMNKQVAAFINIQNIPSIKEWLDRIVFIETRQNSDILAPLIIEILEYAEENAGFRERLALSIEASIGSCDDRISLYTNHIYIEKKLFSIDFTHSSDLLNFLLQVAFPISLIDQIAAQRSISVGVQRSQERYEEEIETYLAYLTGLNTKLSLGLPIPTMLFETMSEVQAEDINTAEEWIRDKMNKANEYLPFLIEHPAWIEFLQTTYPKEMNEIDEKAVDIIDMYSANSNDLMNHAEDAQKFRKSYLALLTRNHLNNIHYRN